MPVPVPVPVAREPAALLDAPYDALAPLPRELWLGALVCSAGQSGPRLAHAHAWLQALERGELPLAALDFGDAEALAPLRQVVGELGLAGFSAGAPKAAQQVLRALFWHLDTLIDRPPSTPRRQAIDAMAAAFRAEWLEQRGDWEAVQALLLGLGDLATLRSDGLRGRLARREWQAAARLAELLTRLPQLAALIASLGRGLPRPAPPEPALCEPGREPSSGHWVETRLPDAPGELLGVRLGNSLARMLPSEAMQLRHPLLHKLWRAKLAEARLMVWDEEAVLREPRRGGVQPLRAAKAPEPPPAARGPMLICVDTSGSMRGAPETLAKAVVLQAARTAHAEKRGCRLIAFGGPHEVLEHDLAFTPEGLDALLDFIGQSFEGGTDLAAPIARAVASVNTEAWQLADLLIVSDGEFGCTEATLQQLDLARAEHGLRVQGVLVGDRETFGMLEACEAIHWVRDWRRYAQDPAQAYADGHSPVHSKSLTALFFPNALSERAKRHLKH